MKLKKTIYSKFYFSKLMIMRKILGFSYISSEITNCRSLLLNKYLTRFGAKLGTGINFKDKLLIDNAEKDFCNLEIGNKCYIGKNVFFDLADKVILEDESVISANVTILSHSDCGDRAMSKWYPRVQKPVRIGSGSWIGAGAVILTGVELGRCCVVAAGSVVTGSFPDRSVVAGVPAKLIKTLENNA